MLGRARFVLACVLRPDVRPAGALGGDDVQVGAPFAVRLNPHSKVRPLLSSRAGAVAEIAVSRLNVSRS